MEITYLSPCKGSIHISVTPYQHLQPLSTTSSSTKTRTKKRSPLKHKNHLLIDDEGEEENERDDSILYTPINEFIDTFRVTIFKQSTNKDKETKKLKKNQILVQSVIILYENQ